MLKIQEFINCFDSMEEAALYLHRNLKVESYAIKMQEGYSVWHFKATQKADFNDPIVREAHCLILYDDGDILARAWPRPYMVNTSSELPDHFNMTGAICEEIPDGSIVVVYNIEGEWHIGTTDSFDGDDYFPGMELPALTYEHEIKALLARRNGNRWSRPFDNTNPYMCFVFSYVSPYLNKVMPVLTPDLYLMAVINNEANIELTNGLVESLAQKMDVSRPNWSEINGATSLTTRLYNMRALVPGLMLRDKNDNRIQIVNPIYNAVKAAKEAGDRVRPSHIAKILQQCRDKADVAAVSATYPGFGDLLELLFNVREELYSELMILWNTAKDERRPAEFAKLVMHHPLNYLMFMFRDNAITSFKDALAELKPIKLTRLARNKWEKQFDQAERLIKFSGGNPNGVEKEDGSIPFCQEGD